MATEAIIRFGKLRCGITRCDVQLGDVRTPSLPRWVDLLEGFEQRKDGVYALHSAAQGLYDSGQPPADAHGGRWRPTGPDSWSWESIPGGPDRERVPHRERVGPGDSVKCPKCGQRNVVNSLI